jgi:hypothetical protein
VARHSKPRVKRELLLLVGIGVLTCLLTVVARADFRVIKRNARMKFVPEYDPVYQEVRISYEARSRGVTMFEMRRRELDAEACPTRKGSDWSDCREALLWGLSEPAYRERSKQTSQCWVHDDTAILQAIPIRERRDHPLWMKKEACIRKVMLGGQLIAPMILGAAPRVLCYFRPSGFWCTSNPNHGRKNRD